MKNSFIEREIWMLTRLGAFQRSGIYNLNVTEKKKREFTDELKIHLNDLIINQYSKVVSEEKHIENIESIIKKSKRFSDFQDVNRVLKKELNFGIAQKLLNLYLKYHWCLGKVELPPHFPVDRILQEKLQLKIIPWTKMEGEKGKEDYLKIIAKAKDKLKDFDCDSIAELELKIFK